MIWWYVSTGLIISYLIFVLSQMKPDDDYKDQL